MTAKHKISLLFLIILLEGYVVLSAEVLAIRQTLPFFGSGTDTVSIIIAAVLMPLAVGYFVGGLYRGRIRDRLVRNLLVAGVFLTLGLSYYVLTHFFDVLVNVLEWRHRLVLATIYVLLFLVTPVYLLGQTVPLVSNYFRHAHLPAVAGKILFFSTVGSFFGAVFTTLLLMNTIGVAHTATVTTGCIAVLVFVLAKQGRYAVRVGALAVFALALGLNSQPLMASLGVVSSNAYNTVQIEETHNRNPTRYLRLNRSYSSAIKPGRPDESVFRYTEFIDRYFLKAFRRSGRKGRVLVLGTGGFTLGHRDGWNRYVYVDIDPDLKDVAETRFLKEKLGKNRIFVDQPARSYLRETKERFDLVIVDLARGPAGIPEHLLTREFFLQVRGALSDEGIMVAHMFANLLFADAHSRYLDNTIRAVFPYTSRHIVDGFTAWKISPEDYGSLLYIARKHEIAERPGIYTDNMNRASVYQGNVVPY